MQSLYQTIRTQLAATALSVLMDGGFFHYGDETSLQQSIRELASFPVIHCDPLRDTPNYATSVSNVSFALGFVTQDTAGSNATEQAQLVEQMEVLCNRFFLALSELDTFEDARPTRQPVYRWTAELLTGVACTFTLNVPMDLCY